MESTNTLADYFSNNQPKVIRDRILDDEFRAQFNLEYHNVITFGDKTRIEQHVFFTSVRNMLNDRTKKVFKDIDGNELSVIFEQGRVVVKSVFNNEDENVLGFVSDLLILSPHQEERLLAINKLIDEIGPAAKDYTEIINVANKRELNEEEVEVLINEHSNGVAAIQRRVLSACQASGASLDEFVPPSLSYFNGFCGPVPDGGDVEDYVTKVLPEYRKKLLKRDLVRGIQLCLLGSIRDDLSPAPWVEEIDNDSLWDAVFVSNSFRDPFSLLGALDIAVARQDDERYAKFSEEAVIKLIQSDFPRLDNVDVYELMPMFAELTLNRINNIEDGAKQAPFLKRMCAWMHAALLVGYTETRGVDIKSFKEWSRSVQTPSGVYSLLLDLRIEPMFRASEFSKESLYQEIIGRLCVLKNRHEALGRNFPHVEEIEEAIKDISEKGVPLGWLFPGPLEGHLRPSDIGGRTLSDDDKNSALKEIDKDPTGNVWSILTYFSQHFELGEEIMEKAREIVSQSSRVSDNDDQKVKLENLEYIVLIIPAQCDTELACVVADDVLTRVSKINTEAEMSKVISILLIASAVFQDDAQWAEWISDKLLGVAKRLPEGKSSSIFLKYLQEIKKVVKLELGVTARAEACASSAI